MNRKDTGTLSYKYGKVLGDIAQLGEHLPCKQGVESSNLFISTWNRLNGSKSFTIVKLGTLTAAHGNEKD